MDLIADILIIFILLSILYLLKGKENANISKMVYGVYFLLTSKLYEVALSLFSSQILDLITSNKAFSSITLVQLINLPMILFEVVGFLMILIFYIKSKK